MSGSLRPDTVVADEALARSLVYRLLSQTFAYPMRSAVEELQDEDLDLARSWSPSLPLAVRDALEAAASLWEAATAEDLEAEFRRLFSHVHSADRPMFETDYGARDVWRQTSVLVDIAGFYRAFGLREDRERPDHVATELEFLHLATYKEAWAQAQGDDAHADLCRDAVRAFLDEHVLRWVPAFAARVAAGAEGPYAAAARLAAAFLEAEAERYGLEVATEAPRPEPESAGALTDDLPSLCGEER